MYLYEITFSPTGGTQKVAQMLSEAFKCEKKTINLLKQTSANKLPTINAEDVCIVAMPVFGGRIPSIAAQRLHTLKGNGAKAVVVAVYGNRATDDAMVEIEDILVDSGFCVVAGIEAIAEHSIARKFANGRPDKEDAEVLLEFGKQIINKLDSNNFTKPDFPGNRPYKVVSEDLRPIIDESLCEKCGTCAKECPAEAIPLDAPNTIETEKCIACMRCISVCPKNARKIEPNTLNAIEQHLAPMCSDKKENKLYI